MFRLRERFVPVLGINVPTFIPPNGKNVPGVGTCAGTERGTSIPRFGTLLGTNVPLVIGVAGTYLGTLRWRTVAAHAPDTTRVHAVGARVRGWRSGGGGWGACGHVGGT